MSVAVAGSNRYDALRFDPMNKKALSERDMCTKFITPALVEAGWDLLTQVREEVSFTKGRVIVRGRMTKSSASTSTKTSPAGVPSKVRPTNTEG